MTIFKLKGLKWFWGKVNWLKWPTEDLNDYNDF